MSRLTGNLGSLLGSADQLARRFTMVPASPARGQGCFSLFASKLFLLFVWILLSRQFFVMAHPAFCAS